MQQHCMSQNYTVQPLYSNFCSMCKHYLPQRTSIYLISQNSPIQTGFSLHFFLHVFVSAMFPSCPEKLIQTNSLITLQGDAES